MCGPIRCSAGLFIRRRWDILASRRASQFPPAEMAPGFARQRQGLPAEPANPEKFAECYCCNVEVVPALFQHEPYRVQNYEAFESRGRRARSRR